MHNKLSFHWLYMGNYIKYNLEIRLVEQGKTNQLAQIIVDYAARNEFTARNIMESVDVALAHMKNNAVLTKED